MPLLIIAALIAAGYWGYTLGKPGITLALPTRRDPEGPTFELLGPTPLVPPKAGTAVPEQVVAVAIEAPTLTKEILDLLSNGQNPVAMHAAASELEKYGFFDAALLLHKRADELIPTAGQTSTIPAFGGTSAVPANAMADGLLQSQLRDAAIREQALRDQILRDQAIRDQVAREQAARDQATQEQIARERATREQAAREQAVRDLAAQEQAAREQAARDLIAREQAARDEAIAREQARLAYRGSFGTE